MQLERRIAGFLKLGAYLKRPGEELASIIIKSQQHNPWFTETNIQLALKHISGQFLDAEKMKGWLNHYKLKDHSGKKVGVVMAGNIPLVGFHDLLCVCVAGHEALVKCAAKDSILVPYIVQKLIECDKSFSNVIKVRSDRLRSFDAVIATGSNNSARYFEQYFGRYPHIIRKSRTSVGVLNGKETQQDIERLEDDLLQYFGLGCRNIAKLYVPEGYDVAALVDKLSRYKHLMDMDKYRHNYDYNLALLLMNKVPYLASDYMLFIEKTDLFSPLSTTYYEYYKDEKDIQRKLSFQEQNVQAVFSKDGGYPGSLPFGTSQSPALDNYADGIDTMAFLSGL